MPKTRFGKLIAVMLLDKDKTRKDLVKETKIANSVLSSYYTGSKSISKSNLDKLCRYFLSLDYSEESMVQLREAAKELRNHYRFIVTSDLDYLILSKLELNLPDLKDNQKQQLIQLLNTFR